LKQLFSSVQCFMKQNPPQKKFSSVSCDLSDGMGRRSDHKDEFSDYFQRKRLKLNKQFNQSSTEQPRDPESLFFSGVSVYCTGLTNPCHDDIRQLITAHGGQYQQYYYPRIITHVIADNLAESKLKSFRDSESAPPVVKAQWVVACVEARKKLVIGPFVLTRSASQTTLSSMATSGEGKQNNNKHGQTTLSSFSTAADVVMGPSKHVGVLSSFVPPAPNSALSDLTLSPPQPGPQSGNNARETNLSPKNIPTANSPPPTTIDALEFSTSTQPLPLQPLIATSVPTDSTSFAPLQFEKELMADARESEPNLITNSAIESNVIATGNVLLPDFTRFVSIASSTNPQQHQQQQRAQTVSVPNFGYNPSVNQTKQSLATSSHAARPLHSSKCTDPGFVEQFFRQSRLHFIGSFKSRVAELHKTHQASRISTGTNSADPSDLLPRTIMHVDMDCFFASAAVRDRSREFFSSINIVANTPIAIFFKLFYMSCRPDLQLCPVAVCHATQGHQGFQSSAEISSANYVARKFGIKAGMELRRAKQLCADLLVMPYEFEKYEKVNSSFSSGHNRSDSFAKHTFNFSDLWRHSQHILSRKSTSSHDQRGRSVSRYHRIGCSP
jgi:DNA repair protein REV1